MNDADKAYALAQKAIADAEKSHANTLNFNKTYFRALAQIPPEIATLAGLERLYLKDTKITDLVPLFGLTVLQVLDLTRTQVTNLEPLAESRGLKSLYLRSTEITDLTPLSRLTGLKLLNLARTQIADLAPLATLTGLNGLVLDHSTASDLTPLAGLTGLQHLYLSHTKVTDLTPLAELTKLLDLDLTNSGVVDLRPIAAMTKLGKNRRHPGLIFSNTPATKSDARLAEMAEIEEPKIRARETIAYLKTLPPYPQPYLPERSGDGSPPQWIGDVAQAVSDALPLDEDIIQDAETGRFDTRPRPLARPDLYGVTIEQVRDALDDVLANPKNGLRADDPLAQRLRRTLDRYANDPQRVEVDFTAARASLMRMMVDGDLPPSDENEHLSSTILQSAQGIRAAHPTIAENRRILQLQALRELPPVAAPELDKIAPVLDAITTGDLQAQMAEDVTILRDKITRPRLPAVTPADAIQPPSPEAQRVIGRTARIVIALRKHKGKVIGEAEVAYLFIEKLDTLIGFLERIWGWIGPFL